MNETRFLIKDMTLLGRRELYDILYNPGRKQELDELIVQQKIVVYTDTNDHFYGSMTRRPTDRSPNELAV